MSPATRQRDDEDYPIDERGRRELMLQAAGFDPEVLGKAARRAFNKLLALMEAKKVTPVIQDGQVTDSIETPDNNIQLRAAQALLDLGLITYKGSQEPKGSGRFVIDLSGWNINVQKRDEQAHS